METSNTNHPQSEQPARTQPSKRRRSVLKTLVFLAAVLAVSAAVARFFLPGIVRDYVNRTLDRNHGYAGTIGQVDMHLWRGAYSISDIRISKRTGNVPVPFFAASKVDFSIQWDALREGRIVGRVLMDKPEINFVDAPAEEGTQTGEGGPWLQMIRDLFPFKINRALVRDGSVHFRAYQTEEPVDVYLSKVQATIDNLGNIRDELDPLVASVDVKALAMDHAKLEYKMTFDPFSYRPTFHMALRLLNLDVTRINDLATAYGKFDFESGWFDLVVEAEAKEGLLKGYAKPLFRDLHVLSLKSDIKEDNVLELFWEALVGGVTSLLKNPRRDQFGTLVPFSGDLTQSTSADILPAIGNILRNAFVRAYLPSLEDGDQTIGNLKFDPPELTDPVSVGNGGQ